MVLTRIIAISTILAAGFPGPGRAQTDPFDRYPAAETPSHARAAPRIESGQSRQYLSALRDAAKQSSNFAGRYTLTSIGCGASCILIATIDKQTGHVVWLKPSICCWPLAMTDPLEFRKNSRLLIIHGQLDETGKSDDVHAYDFDGRRFVPLNEP